MLKGDPQSLLDLNMAEQCQRRTVGGLASQDMASYRVTAQILQIP